MKLEYLNYISLLFQIIICYVFFANVLKFKFKTFKTMLIFSCVLIFTFTITFPIRVLPLLKPMIMAIVLYITFRKISESSSKRIVMSIIIAIGCSILTDGFAYYIYGVFTNFDYTNAYEISVTRTTVSLFSSIFYFTITMTIAFFMNNFAVNIKKFCMVLLIIVPISQFLLLFGIYINNYANFNERVLQYGFLCLSISIAVDIIIYFIIKEYARISKVEKEIEIKNIHREMELAYYQQVAKNEEELRKLKHDVKNQLQAAYAIFDLGDQGRVKAKGIVEGINAKMEDIEGIYYCENPIVNIIIAIKALEAKECHIKTNVEIGVIDNNIEDIDLCSIFTNLFDNALEACKKNKTNSNNFIKVKVGEKGGYLIVKFINSWDEELKLNNKKLIITSKKDKKNHGYGLQILKEIAKKYHGEFKIKAEDNFFEAILYLKVS